MEKLVVDDFMPVIDLLDETSLSNVILASENSRNILSNSAKHLKDFTLQVVKTNYEDFFKERDFYVPLKNIAVSFNIAMNTQNVANFINKFQDTLESLELNNFKFNDFIDISNILSNLVNLKSLRLNDCHICFVNNQTLLPMRALTSLLFNKCNDNMFKIFTKQEALKKITVGNNEWTWNGFPHEIFNEICRNCKNLDHLVLEGAGTGSYFDHDEFPYKITKLETTMISFHWYVGIRSARSTFLESQKGFLKDLTIHELPYDFDGGKLLKYIIEEMDLNNFYYGDIPLIIKKVKQIVEEFTASEIQITSAIEMVKQFICFKFKLKLSKIDVASDEIEKTINPPTDAFKNIKEFEVVDNSAYRGIFGVFLGLFKNLGNVEKLKLITMDRNINTILECLPKMEALKEIHLTSKAPRIAERLKAIKKCAPNLRKLSLPKMYAKAATSVFDKIEINGI